jgi:hypothetical protein
MCAVVVCVTILCLLKDGVARAAVVAACSCIASLPPHDLLCCSGCRCGHTPRSWYFAAYNTGVVIARNTPNAITVGGEGAHCGDLGGAGLMAQGVASRSGHLLQPQCCTGSAHCSHPLHVSCVGTLLRHTCCARAHDCWVKLGRALTLCVPLLAGAGRME